MKTKNKGLKIKTRVRAGGIFLNHNEQQAQAKAKGLKIKTRVRAGFRLLRRFGLDTGTTDPMD